MQQEAQQIPRKVLGNTKTEVSRIGYGCMGLSAFYTTDPIPEEQGIEIIGKAIEQGQNFFDTAYIYGDNEKLLGKAIKKFGRDKFFLATKFPAMLIKGQERVKNPGTVENIKEYCRQSLERLDIDQIDLYYAHRVDSEIPIEKQVEGFKQLIEEGKIRFYGLSEASEDSIRRAHKYYPLTAVQEEFSLQTRDIEENGVLKACKELGIAVVAYSPIGRGLLTGAVKSTSELEKTDFRQSLAPRFQGENLQKNVQQVEELKKIAVELKVTPSQLALAWLLHKGDNIFPIPGTKREKYLIENQNAAQIKLTPEVVKKIDDLFPLGSTAGLRYPQEYMHFTNISTPPLQ
ncbi:NADP-dependent oxidoreductase domain [Pseudocohnilembus persalinus]|uniref:NADP-dependent oxidoreductase domain n=1 Tax=Pseudocohnilembus persalinus TaxID=266149 RepID=A0A0V0QQ84_PSEPJ|nr:NADP-dependent oxidoreductase domain [Pseudocohnilembus persalinus]|eukprot:KRX04333.1 NADP-dependent oxidoreductase domain [Pseudocohnilembus persalinus]